MEKINCSQFTENLLDFIQGTMDQQTRTAFEAHAGCCEKCRSRLHKETMILEGIQDASDVPMLSPGFNQRVLERIRNAGPASADNVQGNVYHGWFRSFAGLKKVAVLFMLFGIVSVLLYFGRSGPGSDRLISSASCEMKVLQGSFLWRKAGQENWNAVPGSGMRISAGDEVRAKGIALGEFRTDEFTVRMETGTQVLFKPQQFQLQQGTVSCRVVPGNPFSVQTDFVRIAVLGTEFKVEHDPKDKTLVELKSGKIKLSNDKGSWLMDPGTKMAVKNSSSQPEILKEILEGPDQKVPVIVKPGFLTGEARTIQDLMK